MLKSFRIGKAIREAVNKAAQLTIDRIKNKYGNIDGKEEDITSKLEDRLGVELVESIESEISGKEIQGLLFDVVTYKKSQEKNVGADIMGIVDIQLNGKRVTKLYLAQCKVGHITKDRFGASIFNCSSSKDILEQAEKMLAITSDSFFFIYTEDAIFTVPAFQIRLCNKTNYINSTELYFKVLGTFYSDFFKCFIGDEKAIPPFDSTKTIRELIKSETFPDLIKFNNLSYVTIKLKDDPNKTKGKQKENQPIT